MKNVHKVVDLCFFAFLAKASLNAPACLVARILIMISVKNYAAVNIIVMKKTHTFFSFVKQLA